MSKKSYYLSKPCFLDNNLEQFYTYPDFNGQEIKKAFWTGKTILPEGCCNIRFIMKDVDTKKEFILYNESYILRINHEEKR